MLVILDGWGLAPAGPGNAISLASTPNYDFYWSHFPHTKLAASGEAVGLPRGQMGNSEVGHLTIGAGRILLQELPRINESIRTGEFFHNKVLDEAFAYAHKNGKKVHLLGLVSPGGIHSHERHLYALLHYAKEAKVHDVYIHAFTDGRDTDPKSGLGSIKKLEEEARNIGVGEIATISGRYYAMDRDHRWERTKLAYDAIVRGVGELADSASEAIENSYALGVTDEFIRPVVLNRNGVVGDGDVVICFNFRSDRQKQFTKALVSPGFKEFDITARPKNLYLVTMTEYDTALLTKGIILPTNPVKDVLAEVISEHGKSQLHTAETEKYPHVTYFINGGTEKPFPGEDRYMVPSPHVATYDLKPEMSAPEITTELLQRIGKYDFIVVNYANGDMVGHTAKKKACIRACEVVDDCLGKVTQKALDEEYDVVIIADHGNIEKIENPDGTPMTTHTTSKVPFILVSKEDFKLREAHEPGLENVAPTVLQLLNIRKPDSMKGESLIR